jgi:preprotein translocase subunit SecG
MTIFLVFLHILVSIALIGIVLLQSGKGAEMGASFGAGGSQSVFGASGGTTFMSKLTTGAAIIFMLTSLTLAYRSSQPGTSSIMKGVQSAPKKPAAPLQLPPTGGKPSGESPAQGKPVQQAPQNSVPPIAPK